VLMNVCLTDASADARHCKLGLVGWLEGRVKAEGLRETSFLAQTSLSKTNLWVACLVRR
jgi:hypothetical protein